jgi:hypothetical protein
MRRLLIVPLAGLLAAACASAQAKGTDAPALDVPPPPPHLIELQAEPLEPVGEIPSPNATPPSGTGAARPGRTSRDVPPKPQGSEAKPETKADSPAQPTPPPENPAPASPPPPNPQLRTADTSADAKSVQTTIDRAKNTLATVNYNPLSNERKKAYKDAQLFIQQAEDALKEGNIVFAQANAGKAETLAHELAGR